MLESGPETDPGWGPALRSVPVMLIPVVGPMRARSVTGGDGLVALRALFCSFIVAIGLIGIVVLVLDRDSGVTDDPAGTTLPTLVAVAVGAIVVGVVRGIGRRVLGCTSPTRIASGFRIRFFLQLAVAETAALVGFVMFILTNSALLFLCGAAFSLLGFALMAPTVGRIRAEADALRSSGCPHGLVASIRGTA